MTVNGCCIFIEINNKSLFDASNYRAKLIPKKQKKLIHCVYRKKKLQQFLSYQIYIFSCVQFICTKISSLHFPSRRGYLRIIWDSYKNFKY